MASVSDRMADINPFYVMQLLARAKELESQGRHIVHMEIGEPDFATPPRVIDAGLDFIRRGAVKYTPAAGLPTLREAIADHYQERYGVVVSPSRIFVTPGASGAFLLVFGIALNPGREVLLADPAYPCNRNFIRLFDGRARLLAVDESTEFQLSAAMVRRHWRDNSAGVLIASPSNPTGTVVASRQLEALVDAVNDKRGFLISDEIYHGLEYGVHAETALKYAGDVFVTNSFSKYFGMTGWRVGWLVVPEAFVDAAEKLAQNIFISAPAHSQFAALATLRKENLAELEWRRKAFEARRDQLYDHLQRLGFVIRAKPRGAFYIYADCSAFTDDSFAFAFDLLEQAGVAVTPGKDFGDNAAATHVRFAYTTSTAEIEEGVRRLERFLSC